MDKKEILRHIDHTPLKPYAVWEDIRILCEEAVEYKTASVCIPPCYVERVHDKFDTLNICTVVGFPLGYSVTAAKLAKVEKALKDGANEIDMVVNISDVKNHQYGKVEAEIRALKEACGGHVLKVIIETCYLTGEEKIAMCQAVTKAGAELYQDFYRLRYRRSHAGRCEAFPRTYRTFGENQGSRRSEEQRGFGNVPGGRLRQDRHFLRSGTSERGGSRRLLKGLPQESNSKSKGEIL